MGDREKKKKNNEELKKKIEEEKEKHKERMKNIEKDKAEELEKVKEKNKAAIKNLEDMSAKSFMELNEKLKEIEDMGEKEAEELKKIHKEKFEEDKKKLKEKQLKRTSTKSNIIKQPDLESEIKNEKDEIQKLINENQKLLGEARNRQNEINFYEMNFGQLFFSDEIKQQIQAQTDVFKTEYENLLKDKMQLFNQYKSDPQLMKFLQLVQTNPALYQYLIPQIYYEFSGQI